MFSSKAQLVKRTPENGTDRESFLSLLVDEYLHSSSYGNYTIVKAKHFFCMIVLSVLYTHYVNVQFLIFSDGKCQVLANLANFAYDPINYQYIRDVGVLDIFLYVIKNESDRQLLHYAVAGLCNLCLGKKVLESL